MSSDAGEPKHVAGIVPGKYSDGTLFDDIHYLECKLILKPDHFTSIRSFHDYGALVKQSAEPVVSQFEIQPQSRVARWPDRWLAPKRIPADQ